MLLLGVMWQRCGFAGCPNVERLASYQPGGATVLLDSQGEPFAELSPGRHAVVALESLPPWVPGAFVAVEDKRFYDHGGIDYRRVGGALLANVRARRVVQGFSTITMQLARNVWPERLPSRARTLRRKALEVRVARDIEDRYTKPEILELYLNHIYFGAGAWGIESASRNYFGKSAAELDAEEAALLASLPKSPTLYNPRRFPERATERRNLVLRLMAATGVLDGARADSLAEQALRVRPDAPSADDGPGESPWFAAVVRRILEAHLGDDAHTIPLRVHTTLDRSHQAAAERALERQLRRIEGGAFGEVQRAVGDSVVDAGDHLQGALVLMETGTGAVRALVGGRDYARSTLDHATLARRRAGGMLRPFVVATALSRGYAASQPVSDSVFRLTLPGGEVWEGHNADGREGGAVSIRQALTASRHAPLSRLAADAGLTPVARLARRAGMNGEFPDVQSVVDGTVGVTPLELAAAYSLFARLGSAVQPRFIERVEDTTGRVLWTPPVVVRAVTDSGAAWIVNDMLRDRAASVVRYDGVMAAQAGGAEDESDVWFAGYTGSHVATVWIGFGRMTPVLPEVARARLAGPAWAEVMRGAAPDAPRWVRPSTVFEAETDPATGARLRPGCEAADAEPVSEFFVRGAEPVSVCPAGAPAAVAVRPVERAGSWFDRRWRSVQRWITRHVGTEGPQEVPRDHDYLGAPRLPHAVDTPDAVAAGR